MTGPVEVRIGAEKGASSLSRHMVIQLVVSRDVVIEFQAWTGGMSNSAMLKSAVEREIAARGLVYSDSPLAETPEERARKETAKVEDLANAEDDQRYDV